MLLKELNKKLSELNEF